MIDYKKRLETQIKVNAWIPRELYDKFKEIHPNFSGWLIQKMNEEIKKPTEK